MSVMHIASLIACGETETKINTTKETTPSNTSNISNESTISKPAGCSHSWVNHTATCNVTNVVHHPAEYTTVHHEAVKQDWLSCNCPGCKCGQKFYGSNALEQLMDHCWIVTGTLNVHCATGTAVTTPAYDEQVLVKDAWDETVTTQESYVDYVYCSKCGQRQ